MTTQRDELRALAEAAIPGQPGDHTPTDGSWEAYFTRHGDPYVVEQGRGVFATVAEVGKQPADYGKARAEYIAAVDPRTILDLLDTLDRLDGRDPPKPVSTALLVASDTMTDDELRQHVRARHGLSAVGLFARAELDLLHRSKHERGADHSHEQLPREGQ